MKHMKMFGELRALLAQGASAQTWETLIALIEQVRQEGDWARFKEQALPYIQHALSEWPSTLVRQAPLAWINRLCFEGERLAEDAPETELEREARGLTYGWFGQHNSGPRRHAADVPELSLVNTILLSERWEHAHPERYQPLDRLAHLFLRDCAYLEGVHTLLHSEVCDDPPSSRNTMVCEAIIADYLSAPAWRHVHTLRLGRLDELELDELMMTGLHVLELVPCADTLKARPADELLHELLGNPFPQRLRELGLSAMMVFDVLEDFDLSVLFHDPKFKRLKTLRIIGLTDELLEEHGISLQELVAQIISVEPRRPQELVIQEYTLWDQDVLDQLQDQDMMGWQLSVRP